MTACHLRPPRCGTMGKGTTGQRRSSEARRAPCGRFRTATTKCDALHHISACGAPRPPGIVITRCKGNRATKTKYSPVAQLAEHSTVNRRVTGSSPVGGAHKARILRAPPWGFLLYLLPWLEPVTTPPYAGAGAPAPGSVWFESSRNILSKPRTSNPSGLRPRRGKDFCFLARSENLRLASSSPVGTFPLSREPVTTPPYAGAGALPPGPRAYALGGVTVFTSSRARKNPHPAVSSPVEERERRTIFCPPLSPRPTGSRGRWAPASGPLIAGRG